MRSIQVEKVAVVLAMLLIHTALWAKDDPNTKWDTFLRPQYFGNQKIIESNDVIEITAPYRAEDPAMVPIKISSKIERESKKSIQQLILLIDENPEPFVGEFKFFQQGGRADLAMRVRINAYSHVRVIARLNNGELHMNKVFVKASGGCSAPISADLAAAMKRLGKMKFRVDKDSSAQLPLRTQLLISHPNITGMQMDQVTRLVKPAHFMNHMDISFNGEKILSAKTDIAVSEDPNFRFYFVPGGPGMLKAEIRDNTGANYSATVDVMP